MALILQWACDMPADTGEAAVRRGDYGQAMRLFTRQAETGNAEAQNSVGVLYYMGLGVPRDLREAAVWFRKAAEARLPKAQFNLGIMYHNGYGMEPDPMQSYLWLYAAEYAGHRGARLYLVPMSSLITVNQMKRAQQMAAPYLAEPAQE